jgi:hypothetical protein
MITDRRAPSEVICMSSRCYLYTISCSYSVALLESVLASAVYQNEIS